MQTVGKQAQSLGHLMWAAYNGTQSASYQFRPAGCQATRCGQVTPSVAIVLRYRLPATGLRQMAAMTAPLAAMMAALAAVTAAFATMTAALAAMMAA